MTPESSVPGRQHVVGPPDTPRPTKPIPSPSVPGAVGEREEPLDVERLGYHDLLDVADAILRHYPPDTIVCSHHVKADPGAKTTAAIADLVASARLSVNEGSAPFTFTATNANDTPEQIRESGWSGVAPVEPQEPR